MDLRVKKTEGSIRQAFLDLRRQKPLEKITVKELCQRAEIHKSTFYSHYEDLYALSDALETQVVEQVIFGLHHPEYVFERPAQFIRELFQGYWTQDERIQILFSGSRSGRMVEKVEESVKQLVFRQRTSFSATRSTGATTPTSAAGTSPGSRWWSSSASCPSGGRSCWISVRAAPPPLRRRSAGDTITPKRWYA